MAMIACFDFGALGSDGSSDGTGVGKKTASKAAAAKAVGAPSTGPVRIAPDESPDRFATGAPCVVPARAPRAEDFPAGRSDKDIRELFARKSRTREDGIQRVLEAARASGRPVERFVAAIKYDSELAPRTTNRKQLLELGIDVPASDSIPASDDAVHHALWTIIYGLARLGIFLTGTDSYDDRALLTKLCSGVLIDPVADIPPSADMSEFIDVTPLRDAAAPDGLAGPYDFGPQDDDDELGVGRSTGTVPTASRRDSMLPRPDRT